MKNIINIIKFSLKGQRVSLMIEGIIILIFILPKLIFNGWIPVEGVAIPLISVVLTINLIVSIVKFSQCISVDDGRILFSAPIKGWEFITAKYLEYFLIQFIVIAFILLATVISGGSLNLVLLVAASIFLGMSIFYIVLTSFIVITGSYFNKTYLCVVMTIVSMIIYSLAINILKLGVIAFLPYVYMSIGDFIEFNIFTGTIDILAFIGLIAMAIYHFDKKLDIV